MVTTERSIPSSSILDRIRVGVVRARDWGVRHRRALAIIAVVLALPVLLVALFPIGVMRPMVERTMSSALGSPVSIGAMSRRDIFSLSPLVELRDVRVRQPDWAGKGDMIKAEQLLVRVPLLPVLLGQGLHPTRLEAVGLALDLVRRSDGQANWQGTGERRQESKDGAERGLANFVIRSGHYRLRDEKRALILAGPIHADERGFRLTGKGTFEGSQATLQFEGPAIYGLAPEDEWPFTLKLESERLELAAEGSTDGPLNLSRMTLDITARAPDLKDLDRIIEAGLFGTQPIDLKAQVRRNGSDWFIRGIGGSIGRSRFSGEASIRKREGRTKIEATLDFAQFDFNDLASDEGLAKARALEARIGRRVLPNTRISLAKVGPTDGVIHFRARRLLTGPDSTFRTLSGDVRLEGKVLTLDNVRSELRSGVMTGKMSVRQQDDGAHFSMDLRFQDGSLGQLLGAADKVDAPFRARIVMSGVGDTIRAALSKGEGHAALVAQDGHVLRVIATVLGQDLGKTIGAALGDKEATVPLRCAAIRFEGKGGVLRSRSFAVETGISLSNGEGAINLDGERIALTLGGISRESSGLPLVDPVRIGGTLSQPALDFAGNDGKGLSVGDAIGAFGKSLGAALGIVHKKGPAVTRPAVGCDGTGVDLLD